jgi:hypothetical protein
LQELQLLGEEQLEQLVGHVVQVFVVLSAYVPFGQLEAFTQDVPERKLVWQLRQFVAVVQFPHGASHEVHIFEEL